MGSSLSQKNQPPSGTQIIQAPSFQPESATAALSINTAPLNNEENLDKLLSGYVRIHGGMKLPGKDTGHSSPLFVINLYKDTSKIDQRTREAHQVNLDQQKSAVNPAHRSTLVEMFMTCTEELRIIPVEDIIAINYKSQFRKSIHREERVDTTKEAYYKGKSIFKKKEYRDVQHVTNKETQDAKRLITVEIEYFKYVNPDSASILRGLNQVEREKLISSMAQSTVLRFNLINSKDFRNDDYSEKQQQAELLCRAVFHLKTLRVYPSIQQLPALFHQESLESLGHIFVERSFGDPLPVKSAQQPIMAIQQQAQGAIEGSQNREEIRPVVTEPEDTGTDDNDESENDDEEREEDAF